ncbi:hypothetical protein R3P38DRAFT_2805149 [Favolaschia claudopus]|uniref:Uncharacterized protein n=1 Tax=Favolaschia claudopus TaxID=2862362 RepID=A0AAV9ZNR8_9AGAR
MSTPLKHIQASISTISEQLLTAQKGFGELKDFISSPRSTTQIFKSDQAEQKFCSINITAHGGTGGVGGHGGQQGGLEEGGKEPSSLSTTQTQCILQLKSPQMKGTGQLFLSLPEFKTWLSNSEKVLWCEGPPGAGKTVLSLCKQLLLNKPLPLMIKIYGNTILTERRSLLLIAEKSDINLYSENQFNKSDNLFRLLKNRPQLKTDIQLAVAQDPNSAWIILRAQPTVASLQEGLKTLPSTLGIAYETTMTRINAQAEGIQKLAHKALMWITNTFRPLSVAELCQAIAIDNEDTCLTSDKISEIDSIMSACAGLVLLNHKKSVVHLIHYTAHEWLQQYFQNAHKQIASTCFQYLAFSDFEELEKINPKLVKQQYPLVVYAHQQLEGNMDSLAPVRRLDFWRHGPWPEHEEVIGSLGLAAAANLKTIAKHILRAREVDPKGERLALSLGVYGEHVEIVKTLLQSSRIKPEWGLQGAIQKKHWEILTPESEPIVKMLLDAGADVNLVGGYYGSALHAATWRQYEPIVKMLLDNGADMNIVGEQANVNIVSGEHGTALQAAAWTESEPIVKMLLDAGADVNLVGGYFGTALQAAASIKSKAGADVNLVGGYYETALHAAACRESEPIVKMLLDNGADMNMLAAIMELHFRLLLICCLTMGLDMNIVGGQYEMLLDAGADVNLVGGYYGTALQTAAYYGTALQAAAYVNSGSIVNILLEKGADMNIWVTPTTDYPAESDPIAESDCTSGSGSSVESDSTAELGYTAGSGSSAGVDSIVKLLLDAGADVNMRGGKYGSALKAAKVLGQQTILQMLLEAGAISTDCDEQEEKQHQSCKWRSQIQMTQADPKILDSQ